MPWRKSLTAGPQACTPQGSARRGRTGYPLVSPASHNGSQICGAQGKMNRRDLSFKNHPEFQDGDSRTLNQVCPSAVQPHKSHALNACPVCWVPRMEGCPLAFQKSLFPNAFFFFTSSGPSSSLDSCFAHFVTNKWIRIKIMGGHFTVHTSPLA